MKKKRWKSGGSPASEDGRTEPATAARRHPWATGIVLVAHTGSNMLAAHHRVSSRVLALQ